MSRFEALLGAHVGIASSYRGWGDVFPDSAQAADAHSGHTLLISWDMGDTAFTRFTTFTHGMHDAYLASVAAAVGSFGAPVYIRPWPEMNADWVPFQPTRTGSLPAGGTYAQFIAAWRYLVTFFRTHGAANARWVFDPTTDTYRGTTSVTSIWPGASYVDVLGLDGYNWGKGGIFTWRSFADIYATQYARLASLAPAMPVWVCEFGSKEPAENDGAPADPFHSKADWYTAMFSYVVSTRINALVFFDVAKERDWRIESDPDALHVVAGHVAEVSPLVR